MQDTPSDQVQVPSSRINLVEEIESALKLLTSQGYTTSDIWKEHNEWIQASDARQPTQFDKDWASHADVEQPISEHLEFAGCPLLSPTYVQAGRQYTLTPGMRDVLRERYGLTPTATVVLTNVGFFSNELKVIWSITLSSAEHIPQTRTRVLKAVVLQPASQFFHDAAIHDKAREAEAKEKSETKDKERQALGLPSKSPITLSLQYLK